MNKYIRTHFCNGLALAVGMSITVFFFALLDRRSPIELDLVHSHVEPGVARMGAPIDIVYYAKHLRECDGYVIPRVIDSDERVYEFAKQQTTYPQLMAKGSRSFVKQLVLPKIMTEGDARYEPIIVRWCNSVQEYVWPIKEKPISIPFKVANP